MSGGAAASAAEATSAAIPAREGARPPLIVSAPVLQNAAERCDPDPSNKYGFSSIVEGRVTDGRLAITVHNCATGKVVAAPVIENTEKR